MHVVSQEFRIRSRALPVLSYACTWCVETGERSGPSGRFRRHEDATGTARAGARRKFGAAMPGLRARNYAPGRVVPLVPLAGEPPLRAAPPEGQRPATAVS